jgi:hypothetical protein
MLIGNRFVFVHQPKTGGHFVREALDEIRRTEMKERRASLTKRLFPPKYQCRHVEPYHGTCHDIPDSQSGKQVLSIVRNPYDFYVSFYYFGWWSSHPEDSYPAIGPVLERFPDFPNLSFEEFLVLANEFFNEFSWIGADKDPDERRLGYYSTQFILYFFREPKAAYRRIASAGGLDRSVLDMFDVTFLRTDRLNDDLVEYLRGQRYPDRWLEPIRRKKPVRPSEEQAARPHRDFRSYYTDETRALIRHKDRLIFSLFPEFDF